MRDRRRDRGVADPHLTDAKDVTSFRRLHAIGHGRRALGLLEGGILCDVAGRFFESEFEDLEAQAEALADLVHRRAIVLEICNHLTGHLLRIGGNALRHDTMVSGKDRNHDPLRLGRVMGLPGAEPFADRFQPAQCARRFGQLPLPRARLLHGLRIGSGKVLQQVPDVIKGQARCCICHFRRRLLFSRSIHHRIRVNHTT